jgi:hypothetical protein
MTALINDDRDQPYCVVQKATASNLSLGALSSHSTQFLAWSLLAQLCHTQKINFTLKNFSPLSKPQA